jgi:hypothetical protein
MLVEREVAPEERNMMTMSETTLNPLCATDLMVVVSVRHLLAIIATPIARKQLNTRKSPNECFLSRLNLEQLFIYQSDQK